MPWVVIIVGYLLGAIPTGFLAGRLLGDIDIRRVGDENMGAANVFRHISPITGIAVGLIDAAKGSVAILIAQAAGISQLAILSTGVAAVIGHNWPVFIGFRGGRGASTTIGVFLVLMTQAMLILGGPALLALVTKKNTNIACAILFAPLWLVCWLLGYPGILVAYSIALPCLVGFTHYLRVRGRVVTQT